MCVFGIIFIIFQENGIMEWYEYSVYDSMYKLKMPVGQY